MVVIILYATDFEYDGIRLKNLGYVICSFDGGGIQTVSNGSEITFNTISMKRGERWGLAGTEYGECLQATFSICKIPCMNEEFEIPVYEVRKLMRWLNRKNYHKLRFIEQDYDNFYFEASFNVNKIEFGNKIVGLELTMFTNKPYTFFDQRTHLLESEKNNWNVILTSLSDEEGYVYPKMEIEIKNAGDLIIQNSLDNSIMEIKNCIPGEKISVDYPLISSSESTHQIQDDFNWKFFRLWKTFQTGQNQLTISIPCKLKISYNPICKMGI